jgi:hypothetical protein
MFLLTSRPQSKAVIQQLRLAASGIAATVAMTMSSALITLVGGPRMSAPALLVRVMGIPLWAAWLLHFGIGVTFALAYGLVEPILGTIRSVITRGAAFGFLVFVAAQASMAVMTRVFGTAPPPVAAMAIMVSLSILHHLVFGIVVALSAERSNIDVGREGE